MILFWACPAEKGGSGYPLQVLALPSSGCGLSTAIPHANGIRENSFSKEKNLLKSARSA